MLVTQKASSGIKPNEAFKIVIFFMFLSADSTAQPVFINPKIPIFDECSLFDLNGIPDF